MRAIRAGAAAVVAVCISFCGTSLLGQVIAKDSESDRQDHRPSKVLTSVADAIKSVIGLRAGEPGFDTNADLNRDGVVNALDVAMLRLGRVREAAASASPANLGPLEASGEATTVVTGERVIVEGQTTVALPGQTVSVLFLIRDNTTPILSYTVETNAVAQAGAVGTITANVALSNFYDQRNIFTAGGAMRDPSFSFIEDNGNGGVSVTTITMDLSTVQAVDNVNDVLAQVFFDVPLDALGDCTIELGSASVLVDGNAAAIPFAFTPGTIRVLEPNEIPAVGEWGMIVLSLLIATVGTVVLAKRHGVVGSKAGQC